MADQRHGLAGGDLERHTADRVRQMRLVAERHVLKAHQRCDRARRRRPHKVGDWRGRIEDPLDPVGSRGDQAEVPRDVGHGDHRRERDGGHHDRDREQGGSQRTGVDQHGGSDQHREQPERAQGIADSMLDAGAPVVRDLGARQGALLVGEPHLLALGGAEGDQLAQPLEGVDDLGVDLPEPCPQLGALRLGASAQPGRHGGQQQ